MKEIKLYRSPKVEKAWRLRKADLERMWKEEHPQWEFKHLFQDIQWLRNNSIDLKFIYPWFFLLNDFKYEDTKLHFTLIPANDKVIDLNPIYNFIKENNYKDYAIVKKSEGSIDYPHYHLLVY